MGVIIINSRKARALFKTLRLWTLVCALVCAAQISPALAEANPTAAPEASGAPESAAGEYVYSYDDMTVTYQGGKLITTKDGKPALALYYDFKNSGAKAEAFIYSFAIAVYQDGKECDPAFSWDFDVAPDDAYAALLSINNGSTLRVAKYFILKNTDSPADVELNRMFAFGGTPMVMTLALPDVTVSSSVSAPSDAQDISITFTHDEAEAIIAAAQAEGKAPEQWLHDIALTEAGKK